VASLSTAQRTIFIEDGNIVLFELHAAQLGGTGPQPSPLMPMKMK